MSQENEKHLFQHVSPRKGAVLTTTTAAPVIKKLNMHSTGTQVEFHFEENQETFYHAHDLIR